jgi:hypothetical protein
MSKANVNASCIRLAFVISLLLSACSGRRDAQRTRVEPRLPLPAGTCVTPRTRAEGEALDQALWTVVHRAPMAREFVDR